MASPYQDMARVEQGVHTNGHPHTMGAGNTAGHRMSDNDPDSPQRWPLLKKVYVSLVATAFAFTVAFGLTSYAVAIPAVMKTFDVSMTVAIIPFSIYLVGIAFAPLHTPHLSERFGRVPVYFVSLFTWALFTLGASRSTSFASLAVTRFFAGLTGGPCLVLIEGTFADVWSGQVTTTYYATLTLASYIGAACGPLINSFVIGATSWRWTQYVPLMVGLATLLLATGMPETYPREIMRQRARRAGVPHNLPKAQSGVTFSEMAKLTILDPVIMLVTEPIVIASTLYLMFVFGTVFQFFISIPPVLEKTYNFGTPQVGMAFISAIIGSLCAWTLAAAIDRVTSLGPRKSIDKTVEIEYRLIPAMFGGILLTISLFWIGWTALPTMHYIVPVLGTWCYVFGNMLVLLSVVSYLFDAYPAEGILSALTAAAVMRLLAAAAIPLVIIPMITNLGGGWAFSTFGFISAALAVLPFLGYVFGARLRSKSRFNAERYNGLKQGISQMSEANGEQMHTNGEQMHMAKGERQGPM